MQPTDSHDRSKKIELSGLPLSDGQLSFAPDSSTAREPNLSGVFLPGEIVGGSYEIIELLGRGAMGIVYKARHITMQAEYALKVLTGEQLNELAVLRFQNEAQAVAKLNHPNLISIFNFGLHDGALPYYVMELLGGENMLDKLDAHGPMPVKVAMSYFIEVSSGLSYAHKKGILHRDIKPANFVLLNEPDVRGARVKVVDFGIVKFAEELKPDAQKLTAIGEVCGSPSYMSPEQSSGQKVDPRADIYSLGCSLYQALTGRLPFMGRNSTETMMMHHSDAPPSLASKANGVFFSEDVEQLVSKMLAKAPMDRYQSMDAVAQDLKNILEDRPLGALLFQPPAAAGTDRSANTVNNFPATSDYDRESFAGQKTFNSDASPPRPRSIDAEVSRPASRTGNFNPPLTQSSDQNFSVESGYYARSGKKVNVMLLGGIALGVAALSGLAFYLVSSQSKKVVPSKNIALGTRDNLLDQAPLPDLMQATPLRLSNVRYFSKKISKDGRDFIEFNFPSSQEAHNLGWIVVNDVPNVQMSGTVRFPVGCKFAIAPSAGVSKTPEFFTKFRSGEIAGIFIVPPFGDDQMFESAAKLPGFSELSIAGCGDLTDKILPTLDKLKLKRFVFGNSNLDPQKLVNLSFMRDLEYLAMRRFKEASLVLKRLKGSNHLVFLDVSEVSLTQDDLKNISSISSLKLLNLNGCRIEADAFSLLARMPKLTGIGAARLRFVGGSLATEVIKLSSLRKLTIMRKQLSKDDLGKLKKERPDIRILEVTEQQLADSANNFADSK